MADFIPLEGTPEIIGPDAIVLSSSAASGTSSSIQSPLAQLLSDLRRKHAAAAGPQIGGGIGAAGGSSAGALVHGSDVDLEDMARRMSEEENDRSYGGNEFAGSGCDQCRGSRVAGLNNYYGARGGGLFGGGFGGRMSARVDPSAPPQLQQQRGGPVGTEAPPERKNAAPASNLAGPDGANGAQQDGPKTATMTQSDGNVCPFCHSTKHFDPLGEIYNRSYGAHHRPSRHGSGVSSATRGTVGFGNVPHLSHEEELLRSTPHLRHLSAASTDMQGAGNTGSRNLFSKIMSPQHRGPSAADVRGGSASVAETTHAGGGAGGSHSYSAASVIDYRTCLARSRANRQTALELAAFLRVLAHEMSLEEFASVENEVFTSIFSLVHSADNRNRLAGVAALDSLIGVPSADEEKKAIKFANNLSNGIRTNNGDYEFLAAVSRALGRMAMGAANVDYVEFEVTRALEWLRTERSDRRLAASMVLKELARNAPTAFYSKTSQATVGHGGTNELLDHIFPVLRDPQPIVRACAADALSECLKILVERKHRSTTGLLCQIYADMMEGFHGGPGQHAGQGPGGAPSHRGKKRGDRDKDSPSSASAPSSAKSEPSHHGSLLVVAEMLDLTGDFMLPRFDEVCLAVLGFTTHPKALIRLETVRLIPRLARRCPGVFGRRYLEQGLNFLIDSARNPPPPRVGVDIRPAAFSAIGQLACAMRMRDRSGGGRSVVRSEDGGTKSSIRPPPSVSKTGAVHSKLPDIFDLVRSGLQKSSTARGGTGADTRCEALRCGADLVEALGDEAAPYVSDLLDDMFRSGLSEDLIRSLHAVAICLPSEQPHIEDRLLEELSLCLAGTSSVRTICDPLATSKNALPPSSARKSSAAQPAAQSRGMPSVTSARSLSSWAAMRGRRGSQVQLLQEQHGDLDGDASSLLNSTSHHNRMDSFAVASLQLDRDDGGPASALVSINTSDRPDVVANLVLSLSTLGSFGENGRTTTTAATSSGTTITLLPFVRDVVAQYLCHPSANVRREAALTCCVLLLPRQHARSKRRLPPQSFESERPSSAHLSSWAPHGLLGGQIGAASGRLIEEVLQKLLRVAVSDPSPLVRICVVRALDVRYDPFLCRGHHLPPLFLLLQDEALATRAAALQLLGRLARLNPAPILPNLRRVLMELIIELRCGRDREGATRLLVVFLRAEALQRLVHPFLPSIINALPLKGVAPRLASAALEALGELAQVSRTSLTPWVRQLIPHILETMQDQSSASKQRTSLRTLGQIAGGTGYVISPYLDYPQLLPQAADVLPGTKRAPWALRREVIRTFGILGALDPDRYNAVAPKTRKGGGVGGGYFIENEDEDDMAKTTEKRAASGLNGTLTSKGLSVNIKATTAINMDLNQSINPTVPNVPNTGPSGVNMAGLHPTGNTTFSDSQRAANLGESIKDIDENSPAHLYMYEQYQMTAQPVSKLPPARRLTPSEEDFYPTVAVQALTRILRDPSLAVHHGMVMQAIMFIFNSLGLRCVPFLKRVVPHILQTVHTCGQASLREALLQQVASLSGIVRDHLRPYVPAIFEVVEEFWSTRHLATILTLVSKMATVPDDFRRYVPRLVGKLLESIDVRVSEWTVVGPYSRGQDSASFEVEKLDLILRSVRTLRSILREYVHLLVPALLKLADSLIVHASNFSGNSPVTQAKVLNLALLTIQTLSILLQAESSPGQSIATSLPARAVQPLVRMLGKDSTANKPIGYAVIEALCVCAKQLGRSRWMPFYHVAVRDAIRSWQEHVGVESSVPPTSAGNDSGGNEAKVESPLVGLTLYDEVIKELMVQPTRKGSSLFGHEGGTVASGGALQQLQQRQTSLLRAGSDKYPSRVAGNGALGTLANETLPAVGPFDTSTDPLESDMHNNPSIQPILNQTSRHRVNQTNLQRAWDVSQRASREDWDEWMRRFAVQLLREAPSPALRATAGLAHAYQPLARELFSAAFVCCWDELNEQYRANLVHSLEAAFVADVSPEILQTLLNLAEFMEHEKEGGLPIDIAVLAELALKCRAYAKALHYKEREHSMGGGGACVEALISINKKLDLPEAALGVLKAAQMELQRSGFEYWDDQNSSINGNGFHHRFSSHVLRNHQGRDMSYSVVASGDDIAAGGGGSWAGAEVQESWLAKLGSWSEALANYERKLKENPHDVGAILGCMRCLDAQGEWRRVIELAEKSWTALSGDGELPVGRDGERAKQTPNNLFVQSRNHRKAVKFCAQAAWRLGQWDDLQVYSSQLVRGKYDSKSSAVGPPKGIRDGGLPRVDFDGAFYSAVLHIHRNEWSLAADAIDAARRAMDSRFTALMAESYKRAYPSMVTAQTLAEMEEIISYRKLECRAKAGASRHSANRADDVEARAQLLSVWRNRLAGCRVDAEVHSSILAVRSLVLGPTDEVEATLTLSALSRQAQCFKLAGRVLLDPLDELGADLNGAVFGFGMPASLGLQQTREGTSNSGAHGSSIDRLVTGEAGIFLPEYGVAQEQYSHKLVRAAGGLERLNIQHKIYYAYVKHLWAMDNHEEAMDRLARLSDVVDLTSHCERKPNNSLRVACWLKLGEWKIAGSTSPASSLPEALQMDVLTAYKRATAADGSGYRAWHAWALLNFRLAKQCYESSNHRDDANGLSGPRTRQRQSAVSSRSLRNHVVAAVKGFVKAISLGTKRWSASVQQDMLNLLTCLFKYGDLQEVATTINDGLGSVTIEAWLGVLPQLLARIHIKSPSVRSVLHPLLTKLGAKHPQALMYPLSVLLKSPVIERKIAAESLMNSLKAHSNALVEEALMVSSELIRVAILWLEMWHEGLEDASRLYFGEGNVSGMLDVLLPLHEQLELGAATRREHDFVKSFGRDLAEAHAYVKEYVRLATSNGGIIPTQGGYMSGATNQYDTGHSVRQNAEAEAALNQAWDLYYTVFRRINKQLPGLTSLELSQCSPALCRAHNLELGVPGSYRVDGSYVKIEKFIPSVQVITSKQRPRKIVLRGSDGKDYVFLLKGHEDLRQDERVMQLFGLVNALLARDRRTNNHDLNIQRYAISPLSHNCGVVGWVPHCDTLHSLIRDYRETKKVPLNMENREMMKMAPDYDLLTVCQKVEVFSEALRRTTGKGKDLYEVLWIQSTNSEEWLERRTKFTRSLAVMSMVGYILGLGDRHPSNLMLDQISGRVLHIDFGDCFEVAMHREKYPEKIPFRLTRMLIKAMEVSGIEGSYRSTCERTMSVLRDSRDSLVAMLEAFVYDPLISWRLLGQASDASADEQSSKSDVAMERASAEPVVVNRDSDSTRNPSGDGRGEQKLDAPLATSHGVMNEPIREGQEEDEEEEGSIIRDGPSNVTRDDSHNAAPVDVSQIGEQVAIDNGREAARSRPSGDEESRRPGEAQASHARSLHIYSNIQSMAANLSTSSRIASITGGGAERVAAEGSIARSRLDKSVRQRELMSLLEGEDGEANEEALNEKALKVIRRVQDKLTGTDFHGPDESPLDVPDQVDRLIVQATSNENLCQLFIGWCAFW